LGKAYTYLRMKFLCLFALAVGAVDLQTSFVDFLKAYHKVYTTEEVAQRFEIFKDNIARIEAHNQKNLSWTLGVNQFADLTAEEFEKQYMGKVKTIVKPTKESELKARMLMAAPRHFQADPALDWRTKGAVSPVRNQGQCGSCWAMTVVSAIESACYILFHNLTQLSTQALMDCSSSAGKRGVQRGVPG